MKRRFSPAWLLLLLFGVVVGLCACGEREEQAPPAAALLPVVAESGAEFSGANAYLHCAEICKLGPRPTGSAAYEAQVLYIEQQLQRAGWRVVRDAFSPLPGRKMQNVRAFFGDSEDPRPLLVSCHIDTKGQGEKSILGADDGASGAAAMLELARVLALQPEVAAQLEFIFLDGEESFAERMSLTDGLYGSRYDVRRRQEALPDRQINLDMVGGAGKVIAVPVEDTSPEMLGFYLRAVQELGLSEDRWTLYPGSYWDDHMPYLEAGVDSLNLIAYFRDGKWWHTQRDDMSRISPASLGETGRVVLHLIAQMLAAPRRVPEAAEAEVL